MPPYLLNPNYDPYSERIGQSRSSNAPGLPPVPGATWGYHESFIPMQGGNYWWDRPQGASSQPPTAGGVQSPLPWQQTAPMPQLPMPQQPILPQQPQQPTIGQEDRSRPWQTPQMSFNLRTPMSMQPNWRQAWNWQQPQQQQQQLPSMQAPLRTSTLSSYDWTS